MREHLPQRTVPVLAMLIAGLYLLLHPYQGLVHDARLYTLQALNHLHPELYGNDVFLKFGSQDSYTLFTPLYAAGISLLGAEPAASLITFVSIIALLVAAWSFARTLMPPSFAWLGLGTLLLTPGFYGSGVTFAVLEGFVTPRLLAEALVLFSLTAWLRERRWLSVALLLAGMVMHPIMTCPAILLLLILNWSSIKNWSSRSWRGFLPMALAAALLIAVGIAVALPIARWQFDTAWWPMADRVPHLVLGHWTSHDWARIATLLSTLSIGALCIPGPIRRISVGMLITCIAALVLSWMGGDLLKIVIVVQGQAWRSLWLATVIAALLLPWVAFNCLKGHALRQCGVLLLIAAWILGPIDLAFYFSIPAALAVACSPLRLNERHERLVVLGSAIVLAVAVLCSLALTLSEYDTDITATNAPAWLQTLRHVSEGGLLPGAVLLGIWYLATSIHSRVALGSLAVVVLVPVMWIASAAVKPWFSERYPVEAQRAFASWRAVIPPGSDVLWATKFVSGGDPMGAWLLLERPSYYSSVQVNSGLFSRPAAMELSRRSKAVPLSLPTEMPIDIAFSGDAGEAPSCGEIPTPYVVTEVVIPEARVVPAPTSLGPPYDKLQLQVCL